METLCRRAKPWSVLLGRMGIAAIFLQSGYDKLFHFDFAVKLMASKNMPLPEVLLVPAIVILLAGGMMLLVGWHARWAALALMAFMVPATLYFHAFWTYPEAQFVNQFHHFFKNLAIIGGLLLVAGMGSGPMSLDRGRD